MIRINLLPAERTTAKRAISFDIGHKLTIACSAVLILAALIVGWRYWTLTKESTQLNTDITAAEKERTRLHSIIQQVQEFEQRRAQLQQRVVLIEQLRQGQTGPVHMLDQISRAMPPMLWLTQLKQGPTDIAIDGRCTTLTALSDFVANLEASGYFKKSVEIVNSQSERQSAADGAELIRFTVRAQFQEPGEAAAAAAAPQPAAGAGRAGR